MINIKEEQQITQIKQLMPLDANIYQIQRQSRIIDDIVGIQKQELVFFGRTQQNLLKQIQITFTPNGLIFNQQQPGNKVETKICDIQFYDLLEIIQQLSKKEYDIQNWNDVNFAQELIWKCYQSPKNSKQKQECPLQ